MGGAFVAVASDASATWWNPAGLGAGPFLDLTMGKAMTEQRGGLPVWRNKTSWLALATPPLGLSYYRFRINDIRPFDPTGGDIAGREDRRAGVPVRSLSVTQWGVTVLRTVVTGVHTGTTVKYVRGTHRSSRADGLLPASELLDHGDALEDGEGEGHFDLDMGILAVAGVVRIGVVARNLREPEFEAPAGSGEAPLRLPRQFRVGVAIDPELAGGIPLTVAFDLDVRGYTTATGERKVVAVGIEQWLIGKRLGVRAGGRVNTVGSKERSVTAGVSIAARPGLFVEGHAVRGGSADEQGWGVGARVSF